MKNIKPDYQKGQILLIVLMALVVAMVIGLSIATRTITTLRMTTAEDNSSRAFSAAEAGIEQALTATINSTVNGTFNNNSSYNTTISQAGGGGSFLVNNGDSIQKDDGADIWLSNYPDYTGQWTGALTIYWGTTANGCNEAALEVIVVSGSKASPVLNTYAFDPCAPRASGNHFTAPGGGATITDSGTGISKTFTYSAPIPVTSGLIARAIPLYADTYMGVAGAGVPAQGALITSIGSSGGSGGTQRKIVSFRGFPRAPTELFQYLIFSPQ